MIITRDLYPYMTRISERYTKLKAIFNEFSCFAASQLTDKKCPVKGIAFLPELEKNYFDVSFMGKKVRFSFFVVENETKSLQGFVRCNPVDVNDKLLDTAIGEFSFNGQGETNVTTTEGDPLYINAERETSFLVLQFLRSMIEKNDSNRNKKLL